MLPHAYYSEIIQTIAALIGFAFGIWAIWDARKDEQFWRKTFDEEREIGRVNNISTEARLGIARVHTASELATVVAQVTLLTIGISGLFLAPPDGYVRLYDSELLGIAISRFGMAFVTAVLAFKSILRRRGRLTYIRTIRRKTDQAGRVHLPSGMAPSQAPVPGMAPSQTQSQRDKENEHS